MGVILISIASVLWATDSIFRVRALSQIDPLWVVWTDHIIAALVLGLFVAIKYGKEATALSTKAWVSALFAGAGGSAIATLCFTASFKYVNPSVSILIQKSQPVIVTFLAILFLRERPKRKFFIWSLVAIAAVLVISFPNLDFGFLKGIELTTHVGALYAIIASVIWAVTTVVGKILTHETPPPLATFWRYVFGAITLTIFTLFQTENPPLTLLLSGQNLGAMAYISLVSGLGAMLLYYQGLSRTRATVATFAELVFPVGAIGINYIVLGYTLEPVQVISACVLFYAVSQIHKAS